MTESFYQTLNYRKADPIDFLPRRLVGRLPHKGSYPDSRSYTAPIIHHFMSHGLHPYILDVGGYIGRFSLESALLVQERGYHIPIHCFEPGLTGNIIKANLMANGVRQLVSLRAEAASDKNGTADYKYLPNVLISGRICPFAGATNNRTVKTTRLDTAIPEIGCAEAAIIKIDTEGHEPSVMAGLGALAYSLPNVCIVEFWPDTLKETVNGQPYADYIEQNFTVLDIKSSLYPRHYNLVPDIRQFAREFKAEEGNVDLLFVSRAVPEADKLVATLRSLAK
jgi:FkbM family methyltransferase